MKDTRESIPKPPPSGEVAHTAPNRRVCPNEAWRGFGMTSGLCRSHPTDHLASNLRPRRTQQPPVPPAQGIASEDLNTALAAAFAARLQVQTNPFILP
jgi:hypothetical protein